MMSDDYTKGLSSCKCECCIYWRRRVHRVAADADSKTGIAKSAVAAIKKDRDYYKSWLNAQIRDYSRLSNELYVLKHRSLLKRLKDVVFPL